MTELSLIEDLLDSRKRERYQALLAAPKPRRKFLLMLPHFSDFDPRTLIKLPPLLETADGVLAELRRRGAGATCYAISISPKIDGLTLPLADAVGRVFSLVEGTILSCIPGRLAYYEGEAPANRFILHRVAP